MWDEDILGADYACTTIDLGEDPDGEGSITASLVKHCACPAQPQAAMLWIHGMSDYFFHTHIAAWCAEHGIAFYALDTRKCGRSRRDGLTPHYVSDISFYFEEIDRAVEIIHSSGDLPLIINGHSTGGLVAALWAHHRPGAAAGVVLNSPWLDFKLGRLPDSAFAVVVNRLAQVGPKVRVPLPESARYAHSMHRSFSGRWEYDLTLKPVGGVGVRPGWMKAIRDGHAMVHAGLDIASPVLVVRSSTSDLTGTQITTATDVVLDVELMSSRLTHIGPHVTEVALEGAAHDVFLSAQPVLDNALESLHNWCTQQGLISLPAR